MVNLRQRLRTEAGAPLTWAPALLAASALLAGPASCVGSQFPVVIDFEELPLTTAQYYFGADGAGGFASREAWFQNAYTPAPEYGPLCCWDGWAYSRAQDVASQGPANQFSAIPGSGAGGSRQYGVGYSAADGGYGNAPLVQLPPGAEPVSIAVANTTWAALAIRDGSPFTHPFGGPSGTEPDWFRLTIYGRDAAAQRVAQVEHYLADYRPADPTADFVQMDWTTIDLTPLAGRGVRQLEFRLASSDAIPAGPQAGILTPAYFAVDDLALLATSTVGADFNDDGAVDRIDLAAWETGWGQYPNGAATLTAGDANRDGRVDGFDWLVWQREFNAGNDATPRGIAAPEPSCLATVIVCMATGLARVLAAAEWRRFARTSRKAGDQPL